MFVLGLDWWVVHDVVHLVALLLLALVLALLAHHLGLLPHLLGLAMLLAAPAHLLDLAMLHAVRLLELDLAMLLAVHLLRLDLAVLLAALPGVLVTCCSLLIIYSCSQDTLATCMIVTGVVVNSILV